MQMTDVCAENYKKQ